VDLEMKKEDWIKDQEPKLKDSEYIDSVLAVYKSFSLNLMPVVPKQIKNDMANVELSLRLHIKELQDNNE
jgi:hypothetical protein